ncbi:BPTI/Kunitz domain-containing protein [Rhodocytophaga rosea]
MPKYYYDTKEKRCKEFTYGGCGGVVPFQTMEECKQCECK